MKSQGIGAWCSLSGRRRAERICFSKSLLLSWRQLVQARIVPPGCKHLSASSTSRIILTSSRVNC